MKSNLFEKTNITSVFNVSKKLNGEAMIPYFKDGKLKQEKIAHLISKDPVYLWNAIYRTGTDVLGYKIGLAKCAYGRLLEVIKKDHPQLFLQKEKRRMGYRRG